MKCLLTVVICLTFASNAIGYDYDRALNNQAHELANCAAYFTVISAVFRNSTDKRDDQGQIADNYQNMMGEAIKYSAMMTNEKVALARAEIEIQQIMKKTEDNPAANISVLFPEYAYVCKDAVENPFKRLKYWIDMK